MEQGDTRAQTKRGNGGNKAMDTENSVSNTVFVGNYDNGIIVTNIDHAITLSGYTVGKLAKKCVDVAPRAVHYLRPDDAAVLYEPLPQEYVEYFHGLYGFSPRTFAPKARYTDMNKPLSLIENMLNDEELLVEVAREGRRCGWRITPFIQHPSVFELARRTGLPVHGMAEDTVKANRVAELNDKAKFQTACRDLGIPIPQSLHVTGLGMIIKAARTIYEQTGKVILRQALGAGGMGNIMVTPEKMEEAGNPTLESFLLDRMQPRAIWETDTVLVEPVYKVLKSPATLCRIEKDSLRLVSHSMQIMQEMCYVGSLAPSGLPFETVDAMVTMSKRYAAYVRSRGGYGYCGIDWGILDDGALVAFESNFRYGGMIHVNEIKRRLRPDNVHGVVTLSNDALKVGKNTEFKTVRKVMVDSGLDWDRDKGEGTIITIPPAGGSMGYVIVAETVRRAMELNTGMQQLAANLPF